MSMNLTNPTHRADECQRESMCDELHAIIDAAAWPEVERQVREMGQGYSPAATGLATTGSSSSGNPVGNADYDARRFDPAAGAEARLGLPSLSVASPRPQHEGDLWKLSLAPADEVTGARGWQNTVEV